MKRSKKGFYVVKPHKAIWCSDKSRAMQTQREEGGTIFTHEEWEVQLGRAQTRMQ
jgi:hypothetical protein